MKVKSALSLIAFSFFAFAATNATGSMTPVDAICSFIDSSVLSLEPESIETTKVPIGIIPEKVKEPLWTFCIDAPDRHSYHGTISYYPLETGK